MKQVTLPQSFTVDVKDMGLVVIETEKWSDQRSRSIEVAENNNGIYRKTKVF